MSVPNAGSNTVSTPCGTIEQTNTAPEVLWGSPEPGPDPTPPRHGHPPAPCRARSDVTRSGHAPTVDPTLWGRGFPQSRLSPSWRRVGRSAPAQCGPRQAAVEAPGAERGVAASEPSRAWRGGPRPGRAAGRAAWPSPSAEGWRRLLGVVRCEGAAASSSSLWPARAASGMSAGP